MVHQLPNLRLTLKSKHLCVDITGISKGLILRKTRVLEGESCSQVKTLMLDLGKRVCKKRNRI